MPDGTFKRKFIYKSDLNEENYLKDIGKEIQGLLSIIGFKHLFNNNVTFV
jgi:hypothetical protein